MRVMCISLIDFTNGLGNDIGKVMDIGDEFNVVGELVGYGKKGARIPCYDLEPWAHTEYVFDKRNFATLPDTPAEVIEEEETELVTA